MKYQQNPTLKQDMKIDYLYYDPADKSIVICYLIKDDQSWVREIMKGNSDRYKKEGFLSHFDETAGDIQMHEIGPKENYPEYFL